MAELPYDTGNVAEAGGGNIIVNFVGRTAFSADAAHVVTVFVINDDGVWLLKRPQEYPRMEVPALVQAACEQRWLDLYERQHPPEPGPHDSGSRTRRVSPPGISSFCLVSGTRLGPLGLLVMRMFRVRARARNPGAHD
jgi:hypothetical protein